MRVHLRHYSVLDIEELVEFSFGDISSEGAIPPKLSCPSKRNELSKLVFLEELDWRKEAGDGGGSNDGSGNEDVGGSDVIEEFGLGMGLV